MPLTLEAWPIKVTMDALPRQSGSGLEIEAALQRSPYPSVRRIRCHLTDGTVKLEGRLPSFYLKQAAQEIVRKLRGVERVDNHIVVDADCETDADASK